MKKTPKICDPDDPDGFKAYMATLFDQHPCLANKPSRRDCLAEEPPNREEENLEMLQQSNSPYVAVRGKGHFVTFCVSRKKVLSGEIDPYNISIVDFLEDEGLW